jgi:hypothetical protein
MPSYDFKTLSPIDFEILVRDLLQREFGFTLESFKPGRDGGIDLRRFIGPKNTLIVQCKHYAAAGFAALLRELERIEAPKVAKLKPRRYVLATSVPLSPANKDAVCDRFSPFCKAPNDVYGRDDLNNLLGKYPELEKHHLKLWITSTTVLESIVHSQLFNTSREELEKIQRRSKVYVYNQSFAEALEILNTRNFCIIAGIPGIGKTTLAEMLALYYLAQEYELIRITSNIHEASAVSGSRRRLFYYDDFLGQSSDADKLEKNEDQRLLDFFDTIRHSRVSKLILTTREYILNQAKRRYERLARGSFDLETYIVDLGKYSRLNKAEILFNHVYFSDLPVAFQAKLVEDRAYLKIIDHPNYNPRFVDILTQLNSVLGLPEDKYVEFFLENLANPFRIWGHAFDNQLTIAARSILLVLVTMPRHTLLDDLRSAFDAYSFTRAGEFSISRDPSDFMFGCKELDGSFVSFTKYSSGLAVQFQNPSVRDFMQAYCVGNTSGILLLLKGAAFFEQLVWLSSYTRGDETEPAFKQEILSNVVLWVQRLRQTIHGESCATRSFLGAGTLGPIRANASFESRVQQLIALRGSYGDCLEVDVLIDECLAEARQRMARKLPKQADVVSLVESLSDLSSASTEESKVTAAAKELLYAKASTLDDFNYLNRLRSSRPQLFDDHELTHMRDEFESTLEREIRYWLDGNESQNPDDIRDYAKLVEELGDWLGVDTAEDVEILKDYADELETGMAPDNDDDGYRPVVEREATDLEIQSLFNSLPLD